MLTSIQTSPVQSCMELSPPTPIGADATPLLIEAINQCRKAGIGKLVLLPGTYHIYPENAFEQFAWISNHDSGLRRTPLPLINFDGFEINGFGAELLIYGQNMVPIMVNNSRNIRLTGFAIDWARPLHFQAEVIAADKNSNSFEVRVLKECNARLHQGKLIWGEGETTPTSRSLVDWQPWQRKMQYDWWQDLGWNHWLDPLTHRPSLYQPQLKQPETNGQCQKPFSKLNENTFRINGLLDTLPAVGQILIAKGAMSPNRTSPAIHLLGTDEIHIEHVAIHHAGGMGVIAEDCSNITLRNIKIAPKEGSGRLVSTTADATHFNLCRGQIIVEDSLFELHLDDAINVHGIYVPIVEQPCPFSVLIRLQHFQQAGVRYAIPGERIRFSNRDTLVGYGERTVAQIHVINEDHIRLTFTEALNDFIFPNSCVDNLDRYPDLTFRNNHVARNRARACLVSTAGKVCISENHFEHQSINAILFESDASFWHESGPAEDVTIENNTFVSENPNTFFIRFNPHTLVEPHSLPPFYRNVRIKGNRFKGASPRIMEGSRISDITLSKNYFEWPETCLKKDPSFVFLASSKINFSQNKTSGNADLLVSNNSQINVIQSSLA